MSCYVEMHYRYYQFFANMLIAILFAYAAWRSTPAGWSGPWGKADAALFAVCVVLFLGSRDALRKYYRRAGDLLSPK